MLGKVMRRVAVGLGLILTTTQYSAADHQVPFSSGNWFCSSSSCCQWTDTDGDGTDEWGQCLFECPLTGFGQGWYTREEIQDCLIE